mmetsp:Transcript_9459/g.38667  ORF Transcript_9459/g.38667 Transcript_9459/m.38667 type:complete len:143 (+) Transcript_9459:597-1025(+)
MSGASKKPEPSCPGSSQSKPELSARTILRRAKPRRVSIACPRCAPERENKAALFLACRRRHHLGFDPMLPRSEQRPSRLHERRSAIRRSRLLPVLSSTKRRHPSRTQCLREALPDGRWGPRVPSQLATRPPPEEGAPPEVVF